MTVGRTPLMAGNWKMNLDHLQATHLVQKLDWTLKDGKHDFGAVEVAVLPPFTDLRSVQTLIDGDQPRAQVRRPGPLRRTTPAPTPVRSRRRSSPSSAAPTSPSATASVASTTTRTTRWSTPRSRRPSGTASRRSSAVGEGLEVRQAGTHVEHVLAQVEAGAEGRPRRAGQSVVVAYEPIWAIGTGEVATPEDAQEVCAAIRTRLAELYSGDVADGIRVLYGGSVKSGNVAAIMAQEDVDGALVGGASIDPDEFAAICRFRDHLQTS